MEALAFISITRMAGGGEFCQTINQEAEYSAEGLESVL